MRLVVVQLEIPPHGVLGVLAYVPQSRRARLLGDREEADLGDLYAESGQTLQGSFSAVSTPIFASKYSLESSRRDLHNALLCIALESTAFASLSNLKIFVKKC